MTTDQALQNLLGNDYRLQWVVGQGGMSTVWLADDLRTQREVAIKVLRPEFSDNNEFLSRFRNEALASENIHSENVVETYDYREATDAAGRTMCCIVMEYVRGESLADMLSRKGSLDEPLALDVLEQAAHGLSIIHRMGLVHRDIKPGNLLITEAGQVKITDFGIAKAAEAVPLTRTGMVVGTAQYVSPEQAQGKSVSAATDVYSLGVVAYEMLAGRRPFSGDSSVSVAIAHINQAPPVLPTTVSAQARELVGIALRKEPGQRYADGNELALAVSAVRMGRRPPQPKSVQLQRVAPQPPRTASTQMLGQVAQPTTVVPATQQVRQVQPRYVPAPAPRRSSAPWVMLVLILAALVGGVVWAASQGMFDSILNPETSTPKPPVVVTVEETTVEEVTPTTVVETPERTAPELPTPTPEPTQSPSILDKLSDLASEQNATPEPSQGGEAP
ncbi:Serine/threonine-protein kinase PknA [Corynebacterium gerontici]|uniref:non-specific serine/threonine protein kinase n=1 Tax=Corynebacterium gerontici TaxID=2079234 RepID=A0A3G6IX65_9CORY|nr:serine/threonine-protein kinase [Corynebacterium gerontici]AZA10369.1 Serine/threonine-protein kinase PknA [Corynebacterium gerontici]